MGRGLMERKWMGTNEVGTDEMGGAHRVCGRESGRGSNDATGGERMTTCAGTQTGGGRIRGAFMRWLNQHLG
jgi:hypothetical protein